MSCIRFDDSNMSIVLKDLTPSLSVKKIRVILESNGIKPILGIIPAIVEENLETTKKNNWAFCILADPSVVEKALTLGSVVAGRNSLTIERYENFKIPLRFCEQLLHIYVPFKWSSQTFWEEIENMNENRPKDTICVPLRFKSSIWFKNEMISESSSIKEVSSISSEMFIQEAKFTCSELLREAIGKTEIVLTSGECILRPIRS